MLSILRFPAVSIVLTAFFFIVGCGTGDRSGGGGVVQTVATDAGPSSTKDSTSRTKPDAVQSCVNDCDTPGVPFCTPTGKVAQCIVGADGCNHPGTPDVCASGATCVGGKCKQTTCTSDCAGKMCGVSDGCGKICGCTSGQTCIDGVCKEPVCAPSCAGMACNVSDGCGGTCACSGGLACINGVCKEPVCTPNCSGKACDVSDGCGGTCECSGGLACMEGTCKLPCKTSDDKCTGDTLHFCGPSGVVINKLCSVADCKSSGFKGYSKCGANPGDTATCLCVGCTAKDTGCTGSVAQVCDLVSGKLTSQTCSGGKVCVSGACVDPCKDECAGSTCFDGKEIPCSKGTDGCYKKLAPKICAKSLVCPVKGKGCAVCSSHAECSDTQICTKSSSCTDPYYVWLNVTIHNATFPLFDANGATWDSNGGLPDPMICISDGSKVLGCTKPKENVLKAKFDETLKIMMFQGDKFCFSAVDSDSDAKIAGDTVDGSCWDPFVSLIKLGTYSGKLYKKKVEISFTIVPAP